jgi:hypothetical protein
MTRKLYYIIFRKVKKKHPHWSNKAIGICATYALKNKKN